MDLSKLFQDGWARHEKESEAVAQELEAAAEAPKTANEALSLLTLSNHTIGEHLKDWPRARDLCERTVGALPEGEDRSMVLGNLAVARLLAGDAVAGLEAETRAASLAPEPVSSILRTRVLAASGLIDGGKLKEGAALYEAVLALARTQPGKLACDRALAITSNNLASAFTDKQGRTGTEDKLMLDAALAAREFWGKCGTWENAERAEYLLAIVHNRLGKTQDALAHAEKGLEIIRANGEEKIDEAFIRLAMVKSHRLAGDASASDEELAKADALATQFPDDGLKQWFAETREKVLA